MAEAIIASVGFRHPQWDAHYYPDDIPDDWKLAYFANEFGACLLTADDIHTCAAYLADIVEDLPTTFQLFLEVPSLPMPTLPPSLLSQIRGMVMPASLAASAAGQDTIAALGLPVGLRSLDAMALDGAIGKLPPCHTSGEIAPLDCSFVSADAAKDLRTLKNCVPDWLASDQPQHLVFVDAGTDIELIRRIEELVGLLS